ncbi:cryptochrome/photolyase family protein [Stenotrophobium rhamnosiphilum]|uniref:Deoxyribodipyrimidine photo-lyase n=1 Tax=Stenotrophobium rhamnosiphilum TaxID=2029166 RepID=A0A2T5MDS5_9GAMM|nr:deoxyribodipyrimidine photo-lyase [Stenotrophobium rhamnosiphilum]PTU30709.1 deoxyribodipyrimidine photolyase [Stenotrophobium rhamnosiphilum]
MTTALLWLRRDLRLTDHPALIAACERHERVLPVYIHAPDEDAPWSPGAASRWWLHHSLKALGDSLKAIGAPLIIREGDSLTSLRALIKETDASAVYWSRLYEPTAIARDTRVKEALRSDEIEAESFNSALLFEPWTLKTLSGEPYRVFTPFWRNASARLHSPVPLAAPEHISAPKKLPKSLPLDALNLLPKIPWAGGFTPRWQPGEAGAFIALNEFCEERMPDYKEARDIPSLDATSSLSPHLHFGEISPRQIIARAQAQAASDDAPGMLAGSEHFAREIGWREFAHHLLFHYPKTPDEPMYASKFGRFPWRKRGESINDLEAWQRGQTGIPIVDAGMRQLWTTGYMHNRVRMIVASLLTKNLLIPWQDGAHWFWDTLVDASLANNTLGWQWVAGCGADAAPYYRIFNPVLQSAKFDPHGIYLRRWVPELAALPDKDLHAPWEKPALLAGTGYPKPIVDLADSRVRALAAYEAIKGTDPA